MHRHDAEGVLCQNKWRRARARARARAAGAGLFDRRVLVAGLFCSKKYCWPVKTGSSQQLHLHAGNVGEDSSSPLS